MYMLITYPIGIIVEAVVLAKGKNRMRVIAAGFPDATELRRSGTQWFTATRQPVEFDFLLSHTRPGGRVAPARRSRVVRAAGSAIPTMRG
jgi:hypothetical protein